MHVGLKEFDLVMRLLPELYRCRTVSDLLRDAVLLLAPLIPSDGCGWFVYAFGAVPRLAAVAESDPILRPGSAARWADAALQHPFVSLWAAERAPSTLMYGDVPARTLTRFIGDFPVMREIGDDNLTIPVTVTPTCAGAVSFRRTRRLFTEDHRAIATLLHPHLTQAYANAQAFSALVSGQPHPTVTGEWPLTDREAQIAFWIGQGKTNREIGIILNIQPRTVEKHVEHVLRKLHVENRTTAALLLAAPDVSGKETA